VWLELVPRRKASGLSSQRLLPKTGGIIGVASCIMTAAYIDSMLHRTQSPSSARQLTAETKEKRPITEQPQQHQQKRSKKDNEEGEDPYAAMMLKINMDIISSGGVDGQQAAGRQNLLSRTFKGLVAEELVNLEPGTEVEMNLFLVEDSEKRTAEEEFPVRSLLRMRVDVTANEDFRYFNNCYHIEPQVCAVRPGICRVAKGTRPCVRVRLRNPRSERVTLHRDAPVALVRLHVDAGHHTSAATSAPLSSNVIPPAATVQPANVGSVKTGASSRTTGVNAAARRLEQSRTLFLRSWERIVSEDVFGKSCQVEVRYPYFTAKGGQPPKVPFGIKDGAELTMRVGPNQDSRPMRVSA
jgi:hypothetical protein